MEPQVSEMNNLIFSIYSSYIPNRTVLCDNKDPPWVANGIRAAIEMEMKNHANKEYIRLGMWHKYLRSP